MQAYRWHSERGFRTVLLATRGRKFLTLICIEANGLHLKTVPKDEERNLEELSKQTTKKSWRSLSRKVGSTKGARRALRNLL